MFVPETWIASSDGSVNDCKIIETEPIPRYRFETVGFYSPHYCCNIIFNVVIINRYYNCISIYDYKKCLYVYLIIGMSNLSYKEGSMRKMSGRRLHKGII